MLSIIFYCWKKIILLLVLYLKFAFFFYFFPEENDWKGGRTLGNEIFEI